MSSKRLGRICASRTENHRSLVIGMLSGIFQAERHDQEFIVAVVGPVDLDVDRSHLDLVILGLEVDLCKDHLLLELI